MSKYIPPNHRKNKKKEEEPEKVTLDTSSQNFPSLGVSTTKQTTWNGRKFSELAKEWKEKKELDDMTKQLGTSSSIETFTLPKFNNIRKFHEKEDATILVEEKPETDDSEWKTVERKVYIPKKKTIEDEIKEEEKKEESDDTVWGTDEKEEYETCWDERRY